MGHWSVIVFRATRARQKEACRHPRALGYPTVVGVDCSVHWKAVLGLGQHVKEVEGQMILPTWGESHHQKSREGHCPHS